MCVCVRARVYVCLDVCVCMHACILECIHVYMYACMDACIHVSYADTHAPTHPPTHPPTTHALTNMRTYTYTRSRNSFFTSPDPLAPSSPHAALHHTRPLSVLSPSDDASPEDSTDPATPKGGSGRGAFTECAGGGSVEEEGNDTYALSPDSVRGGREWRCSRALCARARTGGGGRVCVRASVW